MLPCKVKERLTLLAREVDLHAFARDPGHHGVVLMDLCEVADRLQHLLISYISEREERRGTGTTGMNFGRLFLDIHTSGGCEPGVMTSPS